VIMATLNAGVVLEGCLKSIREQDYDQKKIEIVVADGGSTDGTVELIKKYGGRVVPEKTGSPEAAYAVALSKAKGEFVLSLASDNVLTSRGWLKKMMKCFLKEPEAIGTYTWRYAYRKKDKVLNRYFALVGGNDPVALFLGRADRQSYLSENWSLKGETEDRGEYFLTKFNRDSLPTVGANGFLIKRERLLKAKVDEKNFFHMDVNWDLLGKDGGEYVVVKNDIAHVSGEGFGVFFKKRFRYMKELYMRDKARRRYLVYRDGDEGKIVAYSFWVITLMGPGLVSLRGFLKIPDMAWFLHPVVSFLMFWVYFLAVMENRLKSLFGKRGGK